MKLITRKVMKRQVFIPWTLCALFAVASTPSIAGEADVLDVKISKSSTDMYRVSVTVKHADEGWDHYADKWDVLDEAGNILGTRVLMHPHVDEQPFTRSLTLSIPMNVKNVTIRAHDKVHGYGGSEFTVKVEQ
ncbi:MAG: hypothetical protein JJ879_15265 [Sneathiella sp.]|nr:hypothetical protein [Sneathiella sp.]